ncbi:MAG: PIG-L deacetylase family protein [Acidimicrobiales bacterium]
MADEPQLESLPEDWNRALAVVAHPDDMEYGASAAVARWTGMDKDVTYLLVTRGEAGIDAIPPDTCGPLREAEQRAACDAVGVSHLEFLDHQDGLVVADLRLRLDLARAIRKHRPEVILSINFRESWGGPSWNHADHRAVGVALLDSVRAAANPWLAHGLDDPAWNGVRFVAFNCSTSATHFVDVTDSIGSGVESLCCHEEYLQALGQSPEEADRWLRASAQAVGEQVGVELAVTFEVLEP